MWFMYLISLLALVVQISFITVSLAAGLYYLAELVEEYTVTAKKCITWLVLCSSLLYVGLAVFEGLPWPMFVCGALAQALYASLLRGFPYVAPMSASFVASLLLLVFNHYLAFNYFGNNHTAFSEVLAYFTLCLWLVPFALFVSLSANDNVLPTTGESRPLLGDNDVVSNYFSGKGKKYGLLSFFSYAKDSILPQRSKKAF